MLEKYIEAFQNLRTDRGRHRWSSLTTFRAPHKPFTLLSVLDLIDEGVITDNFIEVSYELLDNFNQYWSRIMPLGTSGNIAYPYSKLKTSGFWHLVPNQGYEEEAKHDIHSVTALREICAGAKLDDELFDLLIEVESRELLRMVIINEYFAEEIRPAIIEQGSVNLHAYRYSEKLLRSEHPEIPSSDQEVLKKVRDQGFRKAIVSIYEHRCSICGIRILTPDGHTVVEAAHIVPWSETQDDNPDNGIAMCRLCHWSFDEGLLGINEDYRVLVSSFLSNASNNAGHIITFRDREILKPTMHKFIPNLTKLDWHRKKIFKRIAVS